MQSPERHYWAVAVAGPFFRLFTYHSNNTAGLKPGVRVRIAFGNKTRTGVVIHATEQPEQTDTKPIEQVLDSEPLWQDADFTTLRWAAEYYHFPLGAVLFSSLPKALREGRSLICTGWQLSKTQPPWPKLLGTKQRAFLEALKQAHPNPVKQQTLPKLSTESRKRLETEGLIGRVEMPDPGDWPAPQVANTAEDVTLNPEQQKAVNAIADSLQAFKVWLLEGITGSGKTVVYLEIIKQVLAQGQQVLVIVPEIALTPQLLNRFAEQLQHKPAVLHSGLADGTRLDAWLAAGSGNARLIVGTRSAAFVPLANPGLMIVDEEHDGSLKQQEGFMYHARDVLIYRARQRLVPIILGSATPSLESLRHALSGHFGHLHLSQRHRRARLPKMQIIDQKKQPMQGGLSPALLKAIEQHLYAGGQVMLYLNRRGFAPSLLCHSCGYVAQCPHCDACMTLHRQIHRLRCHHCGHEQSPPPQCPDCHAPLMIQGLGTEQLETVLTQHFPGFPLARLDRDATSRRGSLEQTLARIHQQEIRIIVGTQMLVKGHDFPEVSLVAIVDADQGLFVADFRGPERFAQNLIQVAGRAGRAERPGTVLIQTHHPEHPVLNQIIQQGYPSVAKALLQERHNAQMPPHTHAALIRADSPEAKEVQQFLQQQALWLQNQQANEVSILGPVTAPLARRAGRFRYQLLIISPQRRILHRLIQHLDQHIGTRRIKRLRWSVDIDPVDLN